MADRRSVRSQSVTALESLKSGRRTWDVFFFNISIIFWVAKTHFSGFRPRVEWSGDYLALSLRIKAWAQVEEKKGDFAQ